MSNNKKKMGKSMAKVTPSVTALSYRGPSRLPRITQQNETYTTQVNNTGAVATSAGGAVTTVFDAYSQLTTPSDWTNISQLYTEYRILSMEVEFIPWNTYNMPTTNILTPFYTVEDRANNTPLASSAQTIAYESVKIKEPSKRFSRVIKMNSAEEAQWIAIGSSPATASRLYIKCWSTGNSNSITLYDFVCRVVVQLRGRQ